MYKTRIFKNVYSSQLESEISDYLALFNPAEIISVNYSANYDGHSIVYTALIIAKADKEDV